MSYSGHTSFYGLPYMMRGDYLSGAEEERRARIIDHLMYAATYGAVKAIVEDANYSLLDQTEDFCRLLLTSKSGGYVFLALVNRRLAFRTAGVELEMARGGYYYIYVTYADGMDVNPTACGVIATTDEYDDQNHLLLAKVDYTGEEAVLDADADKQYIVNLAAHSLDNTNPHGTTLYQDALVLTRLLMRRSPEDEGTPINPVFYRKVHAPGEGFFNIVSVQGVRPVFVSCMVDSLAIGNVAIHINSDNTIEVRNSGVSDTGEEESITLRIEGEYV